VATAAGVARPWEWLLLPGLESRLGVPAPVPLQRTVAGDGAATVTAGRPGAVALDPAGREAVGSQPEPIAPPVAMSAPGAAAAARPAVPTGWKAAAAHAPGGAPPPARIAAASSLGGGAGASGGLATAGEDHLLVRGQQTVEGLAPLVERGGGAAAVDVAPGAELGGSGVLDIELGGTAPEPYDRLLVEGTLSLAGTDRVELIDGFTPAAGDRFDVAHAGDIAAAAAHFELPELPGDARFAAVVNAEPGGEALRIQTVSTGLSITAVPEPSTGVLLVFGMAGLARIGRRR
jgi:hypothetical protein